MPVAQLEFIEANRAAEESMSSRRIDVESQKAAHVLEIAPPEERRWHHSVSLSERLLHLSLAPASKQESRGK